MRILLEESLPIELRDVLPQHSVRSVQEKGWSALKNGELLRHAVDAFDVFVTADQNLHYQQNIKALPIAVAVLVVHRPRARHVASELRRLDPKGTPNGYDKLSYLGGTS